MSMTSQRFSVRTSKSEDGITIMNDGFCMILAEMNFQGWHGQGMVWLDGQNTLRERKG